MTLYASSKSPGISPEASDPQDPYRHCFTQDRSLSHKVIWGGSLVIAVGSFVVGKVLGADPATTNILSVASFATGSLWLLSRWITKVEWVLSGSCLQEKRLWGWKEEAIPLSQIGCIKVSKGPLSRFTATGKVFVYRSTSPTPAIVIDRQRHPQKVKEALQKLLDQQHTQHSDLF